MSTDPHGPTAEPPLAAGFRRPRWWVVLKWSLCLLVVAFVGWRGWELWHRDELGELDVAAGWLLPAAVVYLAGWLPSAWFWRRLMQRMTSGWPGQSGACPGAANAGASLRSSPGHPPPPRKETPDPLGWAGVLRAHYCGHLGKYVPGKATVLVIRAALMKARGYSAALAAVTAVVETLLSMAVGAALALALFPLTGWPADLSRRVGSGWLVTLGVLAVVVALLPVGSLLLSHLAVRMSPRKPLIDEHQSSVPVSLLAAGVVLMAAGWLLHGLSLGLTLEAVGGGSLEPSGWPAWTAAVAASTVVGFVAVFAPGGIGVREGILIEMLLLQPGVGEKQAVAAAVLLRLAWLAAEITAAAGLYWLVRPREG